MKLHGKTDLNYLVHTGLINEIKLEDLRKLTKRVGIKGASRLCKSETIVALRSCSPYPQRVKIDFQVE